MEWAALETLLALGHVPVGAADAGGYREWVGEPALPADVAEVGEASQEADDEQHSGALRFFVTLFRLVVEDGVERGVQVAMSGPDDLALLVWQLGAFQRGVDHCLVAWIG